MFIPMLIFIIAIFLAFSTGTSWGTFAILVPIVIAMFPEQGHMEMMIISVSTTLYAVVVAVPVWNMHGRYSGLLTRRMPLPLP
mgnify:CR=1 FL=1